MNSVKTTNAADIALLRNFSKDIYGELKKNNGSMMDPWDFRGKSKYGNQKGSGCPPQIQFVCGNGTNSAKNRINYKSNFDRKVENYTDQITENNPDLSRKEIEDLALILRSKLKEMKDHSNHLHLFQGWRK